MFDSFDFSIVRYKIQINPFIYIPNDFLGLDDKEKCRPMFDINQRRKQSTNKSTKECSLTCLLKPPQEVILQQKHLSKLVKRV